MIEAIFITPKHGSPQFSVSEAALVAGKGIVGDRNFGESTWPGQNVTFIEAEEIESFNSTYRRSATQAEIGRNVVTRAIRLQSLVGKSFCVGDVQFFGVELCEPCKTLGNRLASGEMPPSEVVKAWLHKGGLRADVLSSGTLRVGMQFNV